MISTHIKFPMGLEKNTDKLPPDPFKESIKYFSKSLPKINPIRNVVTGIFILVNK